MLTNNNNTRYFCFNVFHMIRIDIFIHHFDQKNIAGEILCESLSIRLLRSYVTIEIEPFVNKTKSKTFVNNECQMFVVSNFKWI